MKQISLWGSRHVWPARIIIVCSMIILHWLAQSMGDLSEEMGYRVPYLLIYPVACICLFALLYYPFSTDRDRYRNFYAARKTFDGLLVISTFLMLFISGNHQKLILPLPKSTHFSQMAASITVEKPVKEKKDKIKSLRKKLKENMQILRKLYRKGTPAEKIALIFLSVVVAAALIMLVLFLSCSIACSGAEGAAILVGVTGTALVIFLFVRVIRGLNRKYPKKPKEPDQTLMR